MIDGCAAPDSLIVEVTEEHARAPRRGHREAQGASRARHGYAGDDVGAGYSGLEPAATLRPTYLKLDRAWSAGSTDPGRVALMHSLADYARATEGLLVAEGVETAAELAHVPRKAQASCRAS